MTPIVHNFRSGPDMQITGIEPTRRMLGEIADRAENMRPAMLAIRELLVAGNEKVFRSLGAAIGTPWPELADSTKARKARSGIPFLSAILVEGGELEESVTGGAGVAKSATKSSARAGTKLFYAIFHMKSRPPIGIPPDTERYADELMERFLLHGVA